MAVNWQLAELTMLLDLCAMKEKHRVGSIFVLVYHLYIPAVLPLEFVQVVWEYLTRSCTGTELPGWAVQSEASGAFLR